MKLVSSILFALTLIGLSSTTLNNNKPRKGALIWEDNFDSLNKSTWKHLITGWRGGNNEFQYYTDRPENSYSRDGLLYVKPTLTADRFGEEFLYNGTLDLNNEGCNINWDGGCVVTAGTDIINPIQSARMVTENSFSFKYGIVETRVKMPKGDWIWPAMWMMPTDNLYGGWPTSGEIDILEVRCNQEITCNGVPNGRQVASQTMHWGPDPNQNRFRLTQYEQVNTEVDFSEDFHIFELHWTPTGMTFYIDDKLVGGVDPPAGGFWELGSPFEGENPWINGTQMAPFDQRFHFIVNVAVGGNFFPDGCVNVPFRKPWIMKEPTEMTKFWEAKSEWYDQTWNAQTEDNAMKVDYIRVYNLE